MITAPASTVSAVWYGTNDLRLEQRELPKLGPLDVLVKVVGCGVCATDLHLLDGSIRLYDPPKVLGHEVGGVVEGVGDRITHVRAGDAVALDTSVACNTCFYCREGRPFNCPNRISVAAGFSDYNVVPGSVVYKLPAGVAPELGALAEPLSCAMHAVARAEVRPADTVAIVGAGALGLLVLCVSRLSGATQLIVSDLDESRRDLAKRLGATRTVDPSAENIVELARSMTDGRGVDVAFEAVGAQATIEQAFELPRQGGTLVQVSVPPTSARPALPAYDLFARELTIRGSFIRTTEFRRAVELLGVLDLSPLITQRFSLRDVDQAITAARSRAGIRVLVGGSEH
ncbi:MAG: zinc-binding dehydrogenase [Chloroflexi bacterium]|nr:zinc-binding dehydrogenase [Chloroflexota bacterium]